MAATSSSSCPIFKKGLEDDSAQTVSGTKTFTAAVQMKESNVGDGTNAPKGYMTLKASGSALNYGETVIWDTADVTGLSVKKNAGADQVAVAGVMAETVASGSFGKVQVSGFHAAVAANGNSTNIAPGDQLSTGSVAAKADKVKSAAPGGILGVSLDTSTTANDTIAAVIKMA